jgi:hypothetical protein
MYEDVPSFDYSFDKKTDTIHVTSVLQILLVMNEMICDVCHK